MNIDWAKKKARRIGELERAVVLDPLSRYTEVRNSEIAEIKKEMAKHRWSVDELGAVRKK